MKLEYGSVFVQNLKKVNVETHEVVGFLDQLLLNLNPNGSCYDAMNALRFDYLLLNKYSYLDLNATTLCFINQNRRNVLDCLNQFRTVLDNDQKKMVDLLIKNYHFQEKLYNKVSFCQKVKRLFLDPMKVG